MNNTAVSDRIPQALLALKAAESQGSLSSTAAGHIRNWLTREEYVDYRHELLRHIEEQVWSTLDDVFWTVIPFGTGGRRGKMYPIGCNAINDRTIGESAQGLADYLRAHVPGPHTCAIAYDTRHRSDEFARLCAEILAAAGFEIYFLQPFRGTPQLSCAIRQFGCTCGIMVTASHNPPSDNAVKVYGSTGGQVVPPHDQGIIACVQRVQQIARVPFAAAEADGRIRHVTQESDQFYQAQVYKQRFAGPRNLKVVYSPMHGVGQTAVVPVLRADGFEHVLVYPPQAEPNGDFPNVPGQVANPENPQVYQAIIEYARQENAELVLVTDPDCDRVGCAAPRAGRISEDWTIFNGNQLAVLLADFVLRRRRDQGKLPIDGYVVKTLVTTEMMARIAADYGLRIVGDLHVGFKWIGSIMDELGPQNFLFGAEESHGYLVGDYARDKDGAVAAMLLAEMAAELKEQNSSLPQRLDELYVRHDYHAERLINVQMPGAQGMSRMRQLMSRVRQQPPSELAGLPVVQIRDYEQLRAMGPAGESQPLVGRPGDLVFLDLQPTGNQVALRPSGTEPKIKFYLFAREPVESPQALQQVKLRVATRLSELEQALRTWCQESET